MKTVPFNPNNKVHLKGFVKWLKKMSKEYGKEPHKYLVIDEKLLAEFKSAKFKIDIKI